jgi:hypothetical protein
MRGTAQPYDRAESGGRVIRWRDAYAAQLQLRRTTVALRHNKPAAKSATDT